jgi:MurNAc alpha-1-phosphate uridylyltransferase
MTKIQTVIMAGGRGTRLGRLTARRPKSLVDVHGRPFLEHQLELLRGSGIRRILLCVGYFGEQIKERIGNGRRLGVAVEYSEEGEELLGTGGALKKAGPFLDDRFFLLWGDSYLLLDYRKIWGAYLNGRCLGLMVVYKNSNERVRSNVAVRDGRVVLYDKWQPPPDMSYIDNGLSAWAKEILGMIPAGRPFEVERLFQELAPRGEVAAFETDQRFYEIGSKAGLAELRRLLTTPRRSVEVGK